MPHTKPGVQPMFSSCDRTWTPLRAASSSAVPSVLPLSTTTTPPGGRDCPSSRSRHCSRSSRLLQVTTTAQTVSAGSHPCATCSQARERLRAVTGAVPTQPRRRRAAVAIAAGACAVVATLVLVLVLSGGEEAARPPARPSPFFARSSFWNARLPARAALDPASNRLVGALAREIERERAAGIGPWIQTDEASTPLYTVGPRQPKVHVALDTGPWRRPLERALQSGVPIPAGARPAAGPDRHITIYQPATDRLWELWRASRRAHGWHAPGGGAPRPAPRRPGHFPPPGR